MSLRNCRRFTTFLLFSTCGCGRGNKQEQDTAGLSLLVNTQSFSFVALTAALDNNSAEGLVIRGYQSNRRQFIIIYLRHFYNSHR